MFVHKTRSLLSGGPSFGGAIYILLLADSEYQSGSDFEGSVTHLNIS